MIIAVGRESDNPKRNRDRLRGTRGAAMEYVEDTSDDRLKGWCIHCGTSIAGASANEDHAPSWVLLDKPPSPRLPVMTVC